MKTLELTLTRIGNSKGIRIPSIILKKYGMTDTLILEQRPDEIVLKTKAKEKLSWRETFVQTARAEESWEDFETTIGDGLNEH